MEIENGVRSKGSYSDLPPEKMSRGKIEKIATAKTEPDYALESLLITFYLKIIHNVFEISSIAYLYL